MLLSDLLDIRLMQHSADYLQHCSIILLTCTLAWAAAVSSGLLSCTASLTCLGCGFSDAAVFAADAAVFLELSRLSPRRVTWSLEPRLLSSLPPGPGFPRARPAMLQYAVLQSQLLHLVTAVCRAAADVLTVRAWSLLRSTG